MYDKFQVSQTRWAECKWNQKSIVLAHLLLKCNRKWLPMCIRRPERNWFKTDKRVHHIMLRYSLLASFVNTALHQNGCIYGTDGFKSSYFTWPKMSSRSFWLLFFIQDITTDSYGNPSPTNPILCSPSELSSTGKNMGESAKSSIDVREIVDVAIKRVIANSFFAWKFIQMKLRL